MLEAIATDFARVPGVRVTTTWDRRLGRPSIDGVDVIEVNSANEELNAFRRLAAQADVTFVIAPEFDGILTARCTLIEEVGGRNVGSSPETVALCSDKLRLARHLEEHRLPTIPTVSLQGNDVPTFPCIIKPRHGAGSLEVHRVSSSEDYERVIEHCRHLKREFIRQPYMAGPALSVAAIVSPKQIDVFPVGEQRLSDDGRFNYLGGRILAGSRVDVSALIEATCRTIPGLRGYVGFDLILADGGPVIVEINPRLTTAYLGYRQLAGENLAGRILDPDRRDAIRWMDRVVEFSADGSIRATEEFSGA